MVSGDQASYSETFYVCVFFLSIRPTDPISRNAFDAKRRKKRGPKGENITKLRIPALALVRANGEGLELEASAS